MSSRSASTMVRHAPWRRILATGLSVWLLLWLLLLGGGAPFEPLAVRAAGCVNPKIFVSLDPTASARFAPVVKVAVRGFSGPGTARYDWGNGQFSAAGIQAGVGGSSLINLSIQPTYAKPGIYTFSTYLQDVCGTTTAAQFALNLPLAPVGAAITCPVKIDTAGFCDIAAGSAVVLTISGDAPGPAGWLWHFSDGTVARGSSWDVPPAPGTFLDAQATSLTADGWLVTPLIRLARLAQPHPPISSYVGYRYAPLNTPVLLGFTAPDPAVDYVAIYVDEALVTEQPSAWFRFAVEGNHIVTYLARYVDGRVQTRQIAIVATPGLNPWVFLAPLLAVDGLVLFWLLRRRPVA